MTPFEIRTLFSRYSETISLRNWNNKSYVLAAVQKDGTKLEYASEELKNDPDIVLVAIKAYGLALTYASDRLKCDRGFILEVVQQNGYALQYTSEELKNDVDIVLAAVKQAGQALEYASEALKDNRDIVLAAIEEDYRALQYASERLSCNRDVVLAAVKLRGMALQYASDELKGDYDVVMIAVTQNGVALQYASEGLRGNHQFISDAVENNPDIVRYLNSPQDRSPPHHIQIETLHRTIGSNLHSPNNLRWLNKESCRRKVVLHIMFLFYLHVALISCFLRASTGTDLSPGWSIAILPISGAFLWLECSQYMDYRADEKSSKYYLNIWNWIELATIGLTISSAVVLLVENSMSSGARNLLTTTGFFLCTFFLSFLRKTFLAFAIFVDGVVHIIAVLIPFIVVSFLLLGTFAFGYSMQNNAENESLEGSLLKLYTKFTDQDDIFDDLEDLIEGRNEPQSTLDASESNKTWKISLDIIFGTLIIILLLNVVIAVVSDAWAEVAKKSKRVYMNNQKDRLRIILHIIAGGGYSRRIHGNMLGLQNFLEKDQNFLDKDWNTQNLKDYLEHWNYPRRDDIEKPHNLCQFGATISMLTCLTLFGFVSFGLTWPMFVREFLFTKTEGAHETETNAIENLMFETNNQTQQIVKEQSQHIESLLRQIMGIQVQQMKQAEKVEKLALENEMQSERIETLLQRMEQQFERMEQRMIQPISSQKETA